MPDPQNTPASFDPASDPQAWLNAFQQSLNGIGRTVDPNAIAPSVSTPGLLTDGMKQLAANGAPDFRAWVGNDSPAFAFHDPLAADWGADQNPAQIDAAQPDESKDQQGPAPGNDADPNPAAPVDTLETSPAAAATIRTYEAPGGKPAARYASLEGGGDTVGIGHKMTPGEDVSKFDPEAAYKADIGRAENVVKRAVAVPLKQNQFDALVSFAMNEPGAFRSSTTGKPNTFLDALNSGDFGAATDHMLTHTTFFDRNKGQRVDSSGLQRRRLREADMFSNGVYRPF